MYPISRPYIKFSYFFDFLKPKSFALSNIEKFENKFAEKFNRKFSCVFPSGRIGLYYLLDALQMKNKEIAISSYTCIVVPYAIEKSGNKILFVEPNENKLVASSKKLSEFSNVIISTHMFGEIADIEEKRNYFVIEDACLAYGSKEGERRAGTMGDVSFFSLNQSKQLSSLGGGIFLTDDQNIYRELKKRQIVNSSFVKNLLFIIKLLTLKIFYCRPIYHVFKKWLRYNGKNNFSLDKNEIDLNDVFLTGQALVGIRQLEEMDKILAKRKEIANWYDHYLKGINLKKPIIENGLELSHYWIILEKDRDKIRKDLFEKGVNIGIANEYSCPLVPYFKDKNYKNNYQWSDFVGKHVINLPFYIGLKEKDVKKICKIFEEVYGDN